MKFLVALCFLSTAVSAFYIQPQTLGRTRVVIAAKKQEQEGYKVVDAARAKECAENFGKCSLDEIKKLRDGEYTFHWHIFKVYLIY